MNLLNVAGSGLAGGLPGSPLTPPAGSFAAPLPSATSTLNGASVPARDSAIANISGISASVNLLQQAAASTISVSAGPNLTIPPLPPMPAPKAAPAVPTDDHGQSNIVFSNQDADGALIH